MSKAYPSNLIRDQHEALQDLLPEAKSGSRPRPLGLWEVLNSIFCPALSRDESMTFACLSGIGSQCLPVQLCLADKGYQGIAKLHASNCTPTKKRRQQKLDKFKRQHNRLLSRLRMVVSTTN